MSTKRVSKTKKPYKKKPKSPQTAKQSTTDATQAKGRISKLRKIVETSTYSKVEGVSIDSFTASAILQVYDALSTQNQIKFASVDIRVMIDWTWKLLKKVG